MFHKMPDPDLPTVLKPYLSVSAMFEKVGEWFVRSHTHMRRDFVLGDKRMSLFSELQDFALTYKTALGPAGFREFVGLLTKMLEIERENNELNSDRSVSAKELQEEFRKIMDGKL